LLLETLDAFEGNCYRIEHKHHFLSSHVTGTLPFFRFTPKHVLYGKLRPYLNKVVLPSFDGVCTTEILPILPNEEKLDRTFLWAILLSPTFVNWATSQISGANLPRLDPKLLAEYEIPLPPLTEQKRIASLLARADRLRQLRRTAHDLGDSVLQSVFLEMFGEPTINSKHWNQATIKELGKVVTGSTPPTEAEGMFGGSIPFITPGDLTVDTLKSQRYVTEEGAKKSRVVRAGSTLVCCIGATIGKTDIAKTKCAFNQQINAIEWDENIQDDFGLTMMKFFSRIVAERGISTTLPILKKSEFEEIVIPVPPLSLQEEFAGVVARVESLRGRMGESTREVEGLFESLLAEAFS
jgi:type I restriction enzyme S subunit